MSMILKNVYVGYLASLRYSLFTDCFDLKIKKNIHFYLDFLNK